MVDKSRQRTTDSPTSVQNTPIKPSTNKGINLSAPTSPFTNVIEGDIDPRLNPIYNFDNYIEGNSNKLARTAGLSIGNDPGKTIFNPLFLYGQSGV